MSEITQKICLNNELGLHARAAAAFVKVAAKFGGCAITVKKDGDEVNGKSITSLIMLAAAKGTSLEIRAVGEGAPECITELKSLVDNNFGEES